MADLHEVIRQESDESALSTACDAHQANDNIVFAELADLIYAGILHDQ